MRELLTFEDVAVMPGKALVEPSEVDLTSKFSRNIEVFVPLVSSPMDTVTDWRMAAILARLGAIGVIHRNMSIEERVAQVRMVKGSTPSPWAEIVRALDKEPLASVYYRMEELGVGGALVFSSGQPVGVIVKPGVDQDYWYSKAVGFLKLLREYKLAPIVDGDGRLRVAAAIGPFEAENAKALDDAGADALVVDVAHAHNVNVIESLASLSKEISADLIVGNLGTREAVLEVLSKVESVSGLRVGIGSGSICSTAEVTGAFMPTLSAVVEARLALEELGLHGKIPIIADGGIRGPGDVVKAFIAGASTVMSGRLFAGTGESPGLKVRIGAKLFKQYRGMGSRGAMERRYASDRYSAPSKSIEEGVEGLVPYVGSVVSVIADIVSGVKAGLGYAGAVNVESAWKARLAKISEAGRGEARPHDVSF
ncbi:MAG: IMP dehydrogenase [Thermoprotei archaeon]|nr:IMP dehydrogenase [Thermoprotei archaeon]